MDELLPFQFNYELGSLEIGTPIIRNTFLEKDSFENDVYQFSINQTADLSLSLNSSDADDDSDLRLYRDSNNNGELDLNDETLAISIDIGNDSIVFPDASPDNYFTAVTYYSGGDDDLIEYELNLFAQTDLPVDNIDNQTVTVEFYPISIAAIDLNADDNGLTYSITGGADQNFFSLNVSTGVLDFIDTPDFNNPRDYQVQVTVSDSTGATSSIDITVKTVTGLGGTFATAIETVDIRPPVISDNDLNGFETQYYRFRNKTTLSSTYIFVGEEERDNILTNPDFNQTFELEGPAFKVRLTPGDDLIAVNRYQSFRNPGTYLFSTASDFQQDFNINQDDFYIEGFAYYAYQPNSGSGTNFYRFENSGLPGTYIFQGPEERANTLAFFPGFIDQGAVWALET